MFHWMVFAMFLLQSMWPNNVKHTPRHKNRPNKPSCQHSTNQSSLNSFLWTIENRDPPSYFFGTIHVPYTKVWDFIPDNTKRAFLRSQYVFFELDLTDPFTISALANCQLLPQGEYLSNILPKELFYRLKKHFDYVKDMLPVWMTSDQRGRGWYADYLFNALAGNWERKRPVWVMLLVNSLTEADIRTRGIPVLDLYLAQEAERLGKQTGAVERVEEQCLPLNDLNFSQVLFALNQTLWHHENTRQKSKRPTYSSEDLIKHYNCGDLNSVIFNHDTAKVPDLVNLSHDVKDTRTARKIDEYFRQELIYKRNRRMGERVIELLKAHPNKSFIFAFGAGHFLGNNTVLDHMQQKGFEISRVLSTDLIPARISDSEQNGPPLSAKMISEQFRPFRKSRRRMDKHKMRHRKKKKRKRKRKERVRPFDFGANFNDLWVRLDPNSPIFKPVPQSTPRPATLVKHRNSNNGSSHHHLSLLRLIVLAVLIATAL